jgi:hypothetical protein
VAQHFPHEERVSFRLEMDGPGQRQDVVVERLARCLRHEGRHTRLIQPDEREAHHTPLATQVGQDLEERMVVVEFGVAVGTDHEQPHRLG